MVCVCEQGWVCPGTEDGVPVFAPRRSSHWQPGRALQRKFVAGVGAVPPGPGPRAASWAVPPLLTGH